MKFYPNRARKPPISRQVLLALATIWVLGSPAGAQQIPEPSPRLEELEFTLGTWETDLRVVDSNGEVVRESKGREVVTLENNGLLLLGSSYQEGGDEPVQRRWQFFDRYKKRLNDVTFDLVGHFERRVETRNGDKLAFGFPEPVSFQDGIFRDWRKTYSEITADSYKVIWEHTDDGLDWTRWAEVSFKRLKE